MWRCGLLLRQKQRAPASPAIAANFGRATFEGRVSFAVRNRFQFRSSFRKHGTIIRSLRFLQNVRSRSTLVYRQAKVEFLPTDEVLPDFCRRQPADHLTFSTIFYSRDGLA